MHERDEKLMPSVFRHVRCLRWRIAATSVTNLAVLSKNAPSSARPRRADDTSLAAYKLAHLAATSVNRFTVRVGSIYAKGAP
jgi:hypothetical protein